MKQIISVGKKERRSEVSGNGDLKMKFKKQLERMNACSDAIDWVGEKTMKEAWQTCERGDWMLWLHSRLFPDRIRELTLAKAYCAATVRNLMKDERSRKAIDVAIAYGEGKATEKELKNAAYAAANAAYAADVAADVAAAAYSANAADVAAYSANAAYAAARANNQRQTADICRKYLKIKKIR